MNVNTQDQKLGIGNTESPPECSECGSNSTTIVDIAGEVAPEGEERQTQGAVAGAIGGALAGSPGGPIGVAIGAGIGGLFAGEMAKESADVTVQCEHCGCQHEFQAYRQGGEVRWTHRDSKQN